MRLNAIEAGAKPTLVIMHGLLGSARNWGGIIRELAPTRHVYAVDLPNHGDSPWTDRMDYASQAAEVAAFIEETGKPAAVLGHSMGGKVAMVLALTRPDLVQSLIVADMAPVTYTQSYTPFIRAMMAANLEGVTRRSQVDEMLAPALPDPRIRAFLLQNLDGGPEGYRWRPNLKALEQGMDDMLHFPSFPEGTAYSGPALFISGSRSDYVSAAHEPAIRALFPNAVIKKVSGAGHWLHADAPEKFVAELHDFLGD